MSKIRILVVEDSALIAEDLALKLGRNQFDVVKICESGEEAIDWLENQLPDLVLLDIKLAGALDGISTGYLIQEKWSLPIIYLSDLADAETVKRAKFTRPANYLTKPFNEADLVRAIDIAFNNYIHDTSVRTAQKSDHIFVKDDNSFVRIDFKDILYLHAERSYCNIVTEEKTYVQAVSMNRVFEQINHPDFMRIHRSYVVNVPKIRGLDGNIVRIGTHALEMSKTLRDELIARLTFLKL